MNQRRSMLLTLVMLIAVPATITPTDASAQRGFRDPATYCAMRYPYGEPFRHTNCLSRQAARNARIAAKRAAKRAAKGELYGRPAQMRRY
jgi:hypothetical protein